MFVWPVCLLCFFAQVTRIPEKLNAPPSLRKGDTFRTSLQRSGVTPAQCDPACRLAVTVGNFDPLFSTGPHGICEHFDSMSAPGYRHGLSVSRSIIESHGSRLWAAAN